MSRRPRQTERLADELIRVSRPAQDPRGPKLLDAHDLAALFSERAGRAVDVVQRTDEERLAELTSEGTPLDVSQLLVSLGAAIREGFMATQTDVVERLTGRRPRSLALVS